MTELKPCPFCGNEKIVIRTLSYSESGMFGAKSVCCLECCAEGGTQGTEKEARECWNRRAERVCIPSAIGGFEPWLQGECCSECGYTCSAFTDYCPGCGARIIREVP